MSHSSGRTRRFRTAVAAAGIVSVGGWLAVPRPVAAAPASPGSIVIGVDHADPADQQPQNGRLFEYTDFFSRQVTVHKGEIVDFRTAANAFHIVGLATDEAKARAAYPFAVKDLGDPKGPNGTKIVFGAGNFPIVNGSVSNPTVGQIDFNGAFGPPDCGTTTTPLCVFTGGDQVQVAGPDPGPTPQDWNVKVDAPVGTYHYFCYIHPTMHGTLTVVDNDHAATTQAKVDQQSADQFAGSRKQARAVEASLNVITHTDDAPGHRTFLVHVGASAADNKVAIDEMLPNPVVTGPMPLHRGDKVAYVWDDPHNIHSVFLPAEPPSFSNDIGPFGFDCDTGYLPIGAGPPCEETGEVGPTAPPYNPPFEVIADPGTTASGAFITDQSQQADAGIKFGTLYGLNTSTSWTIRTDHNSATGAPYLFHCTVHDFMVGAFTVSA